MERWPHLEQVHIHHADAEQIETNVPRAMELVVVIRSFNGGLYAVRTVLGWTVN